LPDHQLKLSAALWAHHVCRVELVVLFHDLQVGLLAYSATAATSFDRLGCGRLGITPAALAGVAKESAFARSQQLLEVRKFQSNLLGSAAFELHDFLCKGFNSSLEVAILGVKQLDCVTKILGIIWAS
jgi:hypothetical protein